MTFNGVDVLIVPNQYLSGPCFSFEWGGVRHLLRNEEEGNRLKILVWRQSSTAHLYTFRFTLGDPTITDQSVLLFVDLFTFFQPYLIAFLTIRNTTTKPIKDLFLQFLLDLNIGGIEHYDENCGAYYATDKVIAQWADGFPTMGFGSPVRPHHWQVSDAIGLHPIEGRWHLNDQAEWGPGDCAIGLEWDYPGVPAGEDGFTPVIIAGGRDYEDFLANYRAGVERAKRITHRVRYSIQHPSRYTPP